MPAASSLVYPVPPGFIPGSGRLTCSSDSGSLISVYTRTSALVNAQQQPLPSALAAEISGCSLEISDKVLFHQSLKSCRFSQREDYRLTNDSISASKAIPPITQYSPISIVATDVSNSGLTRKPMPAIRVSTPARTEACPPLT